MQFPYEALTIAIGIISLVWLASQVGGRIFPPIETTLELRQSREDMRRRIEILEHRCEDLDRKLQECYQSVMSEMQRRQTSPHPDAGASNVIITGDVHAKDIAGGAKNVGQNDISAGRDANVRKSE